MKSFDGKIAGVGSAKDTIDVQQPQAEMRGHIGPIGDEPSIIGVFPAPDKWRAGGYRCNVRSGLGYIPR